MKFDTILEQGAYNPAENRNSIGVPIYQSSAFYFDTVQYAADLFDLKCGGDIYSRLSNPTVDVLEQRLAALEGGVGALCTSSGQSASLIAVLNIAKAGDEIVASSSLYGGTYNLLNFTLRRLGINTTFVNVNDLAAVKAAITDKTKGIFAEMIGNPKLDTPDVEALSKLAHDNGIPLIIDNTVPSPFLYNPIKHGADIVVHSMTKYISGHGNMMGGVVIDSGNFDWAKSGKFDCLAKPDASYHGLTYTEAFGKAAFIVRARANLVRDLGCCLNANAASMFLTGLETLHLRMKRHSESALKVAQFLKSNPYAENVNYPLCEENENYDLAKKYFTKGASSIVTFEVKGGKEKAVKFIENLKLFIHATNIGDARSIVTYPCLTTHRQLNDEELKACGISSTFIRLSIGLEDIDDIIADLDKALKA